MIESAPLTIGWASADLTPERPVQLAGQFYARVSEGVMDPVTATVLVLASGDGEVGSTVVLVSCDLVAISDTLRDAVRNRIASLLPDLDLRAVVLNGTHTHTAPEVRVPADTQRMGGGISSAGMAVSLPAMDPADYVSLAADRIAQAVFEAWSTRKQGSLGYGLGYAVVGRNRRSVYAGGESRMYGDTREPSFTHIEGYEDPSVNLLATWDASGGLTGLVVNVPSPAQVSEHLFQLSADYWHEVRVELRRRLGGELFVLPQCSAAGDQSPHVQVGKDAEERMARLAGRTQREEIALRIADAVSAALPVIAQDPLVAPILRHQVDTVPLTRRTLSTADVQDAMAEAAVLRAEYEALRAELDEHPERRQMPRWYVPITQAYRRMKWNEGVATRYEIECTHPRLAVELHALRLGDMALVTNPFELYLDFAVRIKARSPAVQTFVVQLAGPGTYLPTERAIAGRSYGAVPASTPVGPAGGQELVEWTVAALESMWAAK